MIEGLRALPWFKEFSRRKQLAIDDCRACKENVSELQRQSLGCGYLPRTDRVSLQVWQPPSHSGRCGYSGPPLTTCAGYTTNLPEILEATIARASAKLGALDHFCEGGVASEELLHSIILLDSEYSAAEHWITTPSKDGGGGA